MLSPYRIFPNTAAYKQGAWATRACVFVSIKTDTDNTNAMPDVALAIKEHIKTFIQCQGKTMLGLTFFISSKDANSLYSLTN